MQSSDTFLFHDYETWGTNPRQDFPCQFAAIRTNSELEPIGEPIDIMCQIPNDYLPHPGACLVTGITPQRSLAQGTNEAEFARKVFVAMSQPNTCSVGYNSLRFDDEVSRFLFFRNFFDPYEREWKNGNSRWDIIDLARACYVLRPQGINWPLNEDGSPSFKLERITQANQIEHQGAHDALVDVRATIALAQLIRRHQPKLFDYGLTLRNKHEVASLFTFSPLTPLLHISSKISSKQGCCTWILPIAQHPTQTNAIICVDLSKDITPIIELSSQELRANLFAKSSELKEGQQRPGIKLVHTNKCPFITSAKALDSDRAHEIGLDRDFCLSNYQRLVKQTDCLAKIVDIYTESPVFDALPADENLYGGSFMTDAEKKLGSTIRSSEAEQLGSIYHGLPNNEFKQRLRLYRGRNFPHTLSEQEMIDWQRHRESSLIEGTKGLRIAEYYAELDRLAAGYENQPNKLALLKVLHEFARNL